MRTVDKETGVQILSHEDFAGEIKYMIVVGHEPLTLTQRELRALRVLLDGLMEAR